MSDAYIDDSDASVAYSGAWQAVYSQRSYRNTNHVTNSTNSRATLTFTGISVMVYCDVRGGESPRSSYSLDGGDQSVFTATSAFTTQYGVLTYTSRVLRNAQHILTITNLGNVNNSLFLDHFIVVSTNSSTDPSTPIISTVSTSPTRSDTTSSISVSHSSTTSRSSSVGTTTLVTFRSSGSSSDVLPPSPGTANAGVMPPNHSRPAPAAIIGAIAAVAIVIFFSVIFVLLGRRRKQRDSDSWRSSFSPGGGHLDAPTETASFATLPSAVAPQMNEQPPCYAVSEPPAYDADVGGSAVQEPVQSNAQLLGSGAREERMIIPNYSE